MPLLLLSYDLRVYVCYVLFNKYSILLRGPGHAPAQKLPLSLAGSEPPRIAWFLGLTRRTAYRLVRPFWHSAAQFSTAVCSQ